MIYVIINPGAEVSPLLVSLKVFIVQIAYEEKSNIILGQQNNTFADVTLVHEDDLTDKST